MSYRRPDTGNSMNDYFSALSDFYQLAPNLLNAKDMMCFMVWFEKLYLIDVRSLVIFVEKNWDVWTAEYQRYARYRLSKWLRI